MKVVALWRYIAVEGLFAVEKYIHIWANMV